MINTKILLYGIFILISIVMGLIVIYKNAKIIKLSKEEKIVSLMVAALGIIFGGKCFTILVNLKKEYGYTEFKKFCLSSYGSILGVIISLVLFSKKYSVFITEYFFVKKCIKGRL